MQLTEEQSSSSDERPQKRTRTSSNASYHDFISLKPPGAEFTTTTLPNRSKYRPLQPKPPLSCAECRRLKLKCDRVFPCKSCTKRGCAEICPEGVLTSGRGSRFILANTDQLHTKIAEMADRIRSLEDALPSSHHLMRPGLLRIKNTVELYGDMGRVSALNNPSPPSANSPGAFSPPASIPAYTPPSNPFSPDRPLSRESHSSNCKLSLDNRSPMSPSSPMGLGFRSYNGSPALPDEIVRLAANFPCTTLTHESSSPSISQPSIDLELRQKLKDHLPTEERARYLYEQAKENAFWQYNPHPSETFFPNLVWHVYNAKVEDIHPQRLSLLYMVLAIGSLVDMNQEPESADGERYHQLARAALCESQIMEDTTVDTIITLFYMTWYMVVFSDKKKAVNHAWGLMGLTCKLAQSIGLHKATQSAKPFHEEEDKKAAIFWEMLHLDARLALTLGRPPSLHLQHIECPAPTYAGYDSGYPAHHPLLHYQMWKHRSYEFYLAPVIELVSSTCAEYIDVLRTDKKVRDYPVPPLLEKEDGPSSRYLTMQKATLSSAIEAVFLQLHRKYFVQALNGPEKLHQRHEYAPSVVAVFRGSIRLISIVETLYSQEQDMTVRFLSFWLNAFSGAAALFFLVTRAPHACLAPMALQELDRALKLFKFAKDVQRKASHVVGSLEDMVYKAHTVYDEWVQKGGREAESNLLAGVDPCKSEERFEEAHRCLLDSLHEAHKVKDEVEHPCPTPAPTRLAKWKHPRSPSEGNFQFETSPDGKGVIPLEKTAKGSTSVRTESRIPRIPSVNVGWGAMQAESEVIRFWI